ncbi:MAG: GNAT family N-acetyltransferase [Intrasporangium sp.]|uniref:GNAT family N-acetyltransferase n=1 Tax=Intrasporangium sp. TaxID=1925024 RepID=UPI003F7DF5AF
MPAPDLTTLTWPRRTGRLLLRPATLDDVDAIHDFRRLPDVVRYLSHDVLSRDQVAARVADRIGRATIEADRPCLGLVVVERGTGRVVGDAMLALERSTSVWTAEMEAWEGVIGYAFHPDVHGCGYATETARELLHLGFGVLGLRRIAAAAYAENVGSNRVLQKVGMRLEGRVLEHSLGKDGRWLDDNEWAMLRHEWDRRGR